VKGLKGVATVFFDDKDIVRHPLVSKIVKAFDSED
jgi:phosphate starvation-inducible protein PhoH